MNKGKVLTLWEGACIITGYGIAAGALSIPYLVQKAGILQSLLIFLVAFSVNYVLHLMIGDLAMKTEGGQIISCLSRFLFRGKGKKILTAVFFVLIFFVLVCNMASYMVAAEEILISLLGVSALIADLLFYIVAAAVVFCGLKVMGISEKIAVFVIFLMLAVLAVGSCFCENFNRIPLFGGNFTESLGFYGMAMFSISEFFSMPQLVEGFHGDGKKVRKATLIGFINTAIVMAVITFFTLLVSGEITEVAMVCWSEAIGTWAQLFGGIITILAMMTTYWSISLALGSIIREQTHFNARICWILATAAPLLLTLLSVGSFMDYMSFAGGVISIIMAVMVVPTFHNARKECPGNSLLGKEIGGLKTQILIIVGYVLMGTGMLFV